MSNQKEILIQDVGDKTKVARFNDNVYRRCIVTGSPLYFAPYFKRTSGYSKESISWISANIQKLI